MPVLISELANRYDLPEKNLANHLRNNNVPVTQSPEGLCISDGFVDRAVQLIESSRTMQQRKKEELRIKEEERARAEVERQRAIASMLITSGFNFDGYHVTKYSGYISGDDVVQIDRGTEGIFFRARNVGDSLSAALVKIRRNALQELKEAAYDLGCNAVIGVDFDYITLDPETANSRGGTTYLPYVFCVTANGNAVVIEKDE